jgi:pSer/pThr/pTyr-binding forkhead associated (FHA) protein
METAMWKLAIEDDQGNKTVVNLVRDEYTVGRSEDNTVRLTERNISRRHSRLHRNGAGWVLEDLASYNGCFVNGVRVSEPQTLEHGDLVQVGDYRLEIVDEQVAAGSFKSTVPAVPKAHSLLSQPDRLVQLAGPTPGAEFALAQPRVIIGRGEECDISINHASVSRVHAEIHALGDGRYEVVDRESANGIRVNGVDLKRSLIDARDTIELGDVVLKFIPAGQIYNPAAETMVQPLAMGPTTMDRATPSLGVEQRITPGIPPIFKGVMVLAGIAVALMIGMVAVGGRSRDPEAAVQSSDSTSGVLAQGMELLKNGEVEQAHQKVVSEIPEDSNARQSAEFRQIEERWADMLFDMASREPDTQKKRAILDRIAKATSVDSVRRKRALNEMAALDQGVDVSELPESAPKTIASTGGKEAGEKPAPGLKNGIVRDDPFAAKKATTKTATKPKPTAEPGGPSIKESATSGDRQQLTAAKNALKAKINSGKGTDQDRAMLRGLCRQLGDMSCVN